MTVVGDSAPPSLGEAAEQLGLAESDLNREFGVVTIDPQRRLYAVEVYADRLPQQDTEAKPYHGPFSSPRIEPFGPVQPGKGKSKPQDQ